MKSMVWSVIFLGVAAFCGLMLYDSWRAEDWLKQEAKSDEEATVRREVGMVPQLPSMVKPVLSYPAELEVESQDGRKLMIVLTARDATHIRFNRVEDGQTFTIPLDQLVNDSRALVEAYPIVSLTESVVEEDAYVKLLRESIKRLDDKMELLEIDFGKSSSQTEKRTIFRQLEDLAREKATLEAEILKRQQQ